MSLLNPSDSHFSTKVAEQAVVAASDASPQWPALQQAADVHGHISQLWIYPVKSCAGVSVQAAQLTSTGLAHDREWMVVDAHGEFLTQRSYPRMALIRPELLAQEAGVAPFLALHAPGATRITVQPGALPVPMQVSVWGDTVLAHDQGDAVAQWLSHWLGTPCRLVRFDPAQQRLCSRKWTGDATAHTQFADGYPLLITTESAGKELNARVQAAGGPVVELLRFRPNIVLQGLEAHEEDHVARLHVVAEGGFATLRPVKPCTRCPIPDIDPATAISSHDVSDALASYRADARMGGAITFGMNAIATQGEGVMLRVGQFVAGELAFD